MMNWATKGLRGLSGLCLLASYGVNFFAGYFMTGSRAMRLINQKISTVFAPYPLILKLSWIALLFLVLFIVFQVRKKRLKRSDQLLIVASAALFFANAWGYAILGVDGVYVATIFQFIALVLAMVASLVDHQVQEKRG